MGAIEFIKKYSYKIYQYAFKRIAPNKSVSIFDSKDTLYALFNFLYLYIGISILYYVFKFIIIAPYDGSFNWSNFAAGVFTISEDIAGDIVERIVVGIIAGIKFGIAIGIVLSIVVGIALKNTAETVKSIVTAIVVVIVGSIMMSIAGGIAGGIIMGTVVPIMGGIAETPEVSTVLTTMVIIVAAIGLVFSDFRLIYIPLHLMQYWRVKFLGHEPFSLFRNSPIYWDDRIRRPLPFLSDFLVILAEANRKEGIKEIEFVSSKRPSQRKAAFSALLDVTIKDLARVKSIQGIADASGNISFVHSFESAHDERFGDAVRSIEDIAIDAKSYLDSSGKYNKLRNINAVANDIDDAKKKMIAIKGSVGHKFLPVINTWSRIITKENKKLTEIENGEFEEIPNPYIFGNPIHPDGKSRLFVGRLDTIQKIESYLSNSSQKPTLFLYGRRRLGKSSILLNLPRFLTKQYISAYIDCQDPGTRENAASFCYTLSKSISNSLNDRGYNTEYPRFESFQNSPFTIIDNWFDQIEIILKTENRLVLISLDEYEKLEESILKNDLTIAILDQLRNIIQHRKQFVVLITGSNELNELQLNWADYLISAKTIKLGSLTQDEARILITNPIDDFNLNYEGGENGDVVNKIIDVTNCHPTFVQALCFELVNHLNDQHRKDAIINDIDVAIENVLISAGNFFHYIWNTECSEKEKKILKRIMHDYPIGRYEKEIESLTKKEIIDKTNGDYIFKVELMKKWIEKNNP